MKPVGPVYTVELFPELYTQLINLLTELTEEEWQQPTVCSPWTVKDLAAHLLDTDLRRLSFQRDKLPPVPPDNPLTSQGDLVGFLDQLNHEWVRAARRISPRLLVELLTLTSQQMCDFLRSLDPHEPALFAVAWAGEEDSSNWFDIAREYTEKWLHQQQIREAVGRPGLNRRYHLYPVLDIFMRALPFTYRNVNAARGTLTVFISGEAGGTWSLQRENGAWHLFHGRSSNPAACVSLSQDTAWRLFSKGLSPVESRRRVHVEGDEVLASAFLNTVSIMA